jgi:hypothetical protein
VSAFWRNCGAMCHIFLFADSQIALSDRRKYVSIIAFIWLNSLNLMLSKYTADKKRNTNCRSNDDSVLSLVEPWFCGKPQRLSLVHDDIVQGFCFWNPRRSFLTRNLFE